MATINGIAWFAGVAQDPSVIEANVTWWVGVPKPTVAAPPPPPAPAHILTHDSGDVNTADGGVIEVAP